MPFIFRKVHNIVLAPSGTLYAWDPALFPSQDTFTDQNRTVTHTNAGGMAWYTGYANAPIPVTKKTVWEVSFTGQSVIVGFSKNPTITGASSNFLGNFAQTAGVQLGSGTGGVVYGNGITKNVSSMGNIVPGDVVAFAYDPVVGKVSMFVNGQGGTLGFTGLISTTIRPAVSMYSSYNSSVSINTTNLNYSYPGYEPAGG